METTQENDILKEPTPGQAEALIKALERIADALERLQPAEVVPGPAPAPAHDTTTGAPLMATKTQEIINYIKLYNLPQDPEFTASVTKIVYTYNLRPDEVRTVLNNVSEHNKRQPVNNIKLYTFSALHKAGKSR